MSSLAINPSFTPQGSRPLPVLFGYGLVSGDPMIPFTTTDNTQMSYVAIADGECDGIEQAAYTATDMLASSRLDTSSLDPTILALLHVNATISFHAGQWTPIGAPQTPFSTGPDQGYDFRFGNIPTVTPPQAFSNISYASVWLPDTTELSRTAIAGPGTLQFFGVVRGARCRYFDINGNVTGYGFTTNPTWHMVEVLLRYKFKRQQPQVAGLTDAEKACFNWPSIVAHAAINDGGMLTSASPTGGTSVVQPPPQVRSFAYALQSNGPGITSPGNVVTVYYNDATRPPPYDPDLVAAFAAGPVYLNVVMKNAEAGFVTPAENVLVTSLGQDVPPGYSSRSFYYFTYNVSGPPRYLESSGQGGFGVTYQRVVSASAPTSTLGPPLYAGSYAFAAKATLASMLETMLRCCQSYLDDQDGQIAFYHYQAVESSFALSQNHIFPGTFKCSKKNLLNAPNVFVSNFRDVNIQALVPVTSVTVSDTGLSDGYQGIEAPLWGAMFETGGQAPFAQGNIIRYGDGSDPTLNHDFIVALNPPPITTDPSPAILVDCPSDIQVAKTATGGYLGTQTSRFGQRSPNTVQHSRHQQATGLVAPGVPTVPNIKPVVYDFGNTTYDQANRLAQYLMNDQLGNDVPGWKAPLTGSVKVRLDAVDANGNAFIRMRPNDRFTVEDLLSSEFAGDYLIDGTTGGIRIVPPSTSEPLGALEVNFKSYNPDAFPTSSYPPDSSLLTIASAGLKYWGSSLMLDMVAWVIQATPVVTTASDGTLTISIPDLTLQILGNVGFTAVAGASWTEVPSTGSAVLFYKPAGSGPAVFYALAGTVQSLTGGSTYPADAYFIMTYGTPIDIVLHVV